MSALPDNFTVFVFDINGLKAVNDVLGHHAGDKLIIGAARCIEKVVGDAGRCYRTGGDEFIVMTNMEKEEAEDILDRLETETEIWSKDHPIFSLSIASGYIRAENYRDYSVEELVKKADQEMYAAKAMHYLKQRQESLKNQE